MEITDKARWVIIIHGGAGMMDRSSTSPDQDKRARSGLRLALKAGSDILASGGPALDAVQQAVCVLEDDPQFNAGYGAVFTADGVVELDAAIMDGTSLRAGSVAGVTRTRNPVKLARAVMESSPHVLLSGQGADAFALLAGTPQVDPSYFHTPERWAQLQTLVENGQSDGAFDAEVKFGTVGAVALDIKGNLAAATSTGGLTGKRWGRIGDSAIIGAGTYADNRACAVSATGSGEFYIRCSVGHEIGARIRLLGESAKVAADIVQSETMHLGGRGGVIVIGANGEPAWSFNTPGMYRGMAAAGSTPLVSIYGDEP